MSKISPHLFDEFFASGKEESISPFLTISSRNWSKHLSLKSACLSAFFLLGAFLFSFTHPPLSSFCLIFVYFFAGMPAFLGALDDIKNFEINIDVLMTIAALLSVLIGSELEGGLLLVLFELSAAMEQMVSDKTKSAVLKLHQITPRFAYVIQSDGHVVPRSIKDISLNCQLLIKAGEYIPLDGIVVDGVSSINLSHLTGESRPITKKKGDEVQAGSRNLDGTLTIEVTRTNADSTLTRIIALLTQAQEAKPKSQRFLDRFGKWYAITIMSLSIGFSLFLPFIFSMPFLGSEGSIYRALTFLIAASPCALIIATPTAYLSAISACAKRGILLKGGVILDAIAQCTTIAFDKTGTITTGKLACVQFVPISTDSIFSVEEALSSAYTLERNTVHPIAEAIIQKALEKKCPSLELQDFQMLPGLGLKGSVCLNERFVSVYIGNADFIVPKLSESTCQQWNKLCKEQPLLQYTLLLVESSLFLFQFEDTIRSDSASVMACLKQKQRLHPVMLTGDEACIARQVGDQVGIQDIYSNLKPEDKLSKVSQLSENAGLIMVGDGINDAPALARATVGISMGKIGSATAIEASDVVLLQDNISCLPWLRDKATKTISLVKQNLFLALAVIIFATIPSLLGLIPLWLAVILHEGGTVVVGLNSLRLLKSKA